MDVARLVADHVGEELLEQRFPGVGAEEAERAQRQALDHDLHAEELEVPAAVAHQRVDHHVEVVVDLVELLQLAGQVGVEGLHVPALVHHLRAAVELGVEPGDRLGDLRRGEERALLAVEELAQHPGHQRAPLAALF